MTFFGSGQNPLPNPQPVPQHVPDLDPQAIARRELAETRGNRGLRALLRRLLRRDGAPRA